MCGIAGILSKDEISGDAIGRMTSRLRHRGPDASASYVSDDRRVALGHVRLSIIDLDARANQPFFSHDRRHVIVFNGEIYNYRSLAKQLVNETGLPLRTTSDTEIIVEGFKHWGADVVNRLDGMFAFAIADLERRELFLARDRMGKKPMYYGQLGASFVFASELKAIAEHPAFATNRQVDQTALYDFLHLGYVPQPRTIYEAVRKFPSGCTGEIGADFKLTTKRFWAPELPVTPRTPEPGQAMAELETLLRDSVLSRLVSDVPVGAFLSGGIDSSLVTALGAREVGSSFKTFSIGFSDSKFDESRFAGRVARHLGTDHHELIVHEKDAEDILETYVRHFDEPFADTSAIPTMMVSRFARQDVKVVMTGDGGDELFLGYGAYTWANRLDRLAWRLTKRPMRQVLRMTKRNRLERASHLLDPVAPDQLRSHIFSQEQYLFSQREIRDHLLKETSGIEPFVYTDPKGSSNWSAAEKQALFDVQYYLKDDLLVKVDRASMYYGLECRCPLLDHHVVSYALALDHSFKERKGVTKWLLKEILRKYIPNELVDRQKKGFSVPLASWLKGDLRYLVDDFANDGVTEQTGLFRVEYVSRLREKFLAGKDYLFNRLWLVILLQKWLKEND